MTRRIVIAAVFLAGAAVLRAQTPVSPSLAGLLAKAGAYVLRFESEFSSVVSEEDYDQTMMPTGPGQLQRGLQRTLRSDFTLVQVPGSPEWLPFRDVFEVDSRPVRDREDRLTKLFLAPTAESIQRARAIVGESARYNVGGLNRTINVPVLAFEVLRPVAQPRFRFSPGKPDKRTAADVDVVDFREIAHPSFIRGPAGQGDLPSTGRLWIERDSGTVRKTELVVDTAIVRAEITATFDEVPGFPIAVPIEMNEVYSSRGRPVVVGRAKYSKFRKFGVEVKDEMK